MRIDGTAIIIRALGYLSGQFVAHGLEEFEVPVVLWLQLCGHSPDGIGNVADYLKLGEIHGVDLRGVEAHMNHFDVVVGHEEGWLLDYIVAHVYNNVCMVNGPMNVITGGQCRIPDELGPSFIHYTLSHLRRTERDAEFVHHGGQHPAG